MKGRVSRRIVGEHRAPELHQLLAVRLAERSNGHLCVCRHDQLGDARGRGHGRQQAGQPTEREIAVRVQAISQHESLAI